MANLFGGNPLKIFNPRLWGEGPMRSPSSGGSRRPMDERMPADMSGGLDPEIQDELDRLGVHLPSNQPDPNSFAGRHPMLSGAIKNAAYSLAAYEPGGSNAAQVSHAMRAALVGGPALQAEQRNAQIAGPLNMAMQMAQLRRQREQLDLMKSQEARNQAYADRQQTLEGQNQNIGQPFQDEGGRLFQAHKFGDPTMLTQTEQAPGSPMASPPAVAEGIPQRGPLGALTPGASFTSPLMGHTKEAQDQITIDHDANGNPVLLNKSAGTMEPFRPSENAGEGPMAPFAPRGGAGGKTLTERIFTMKNSPDPAIRAQGEALERDQLRNIGASAGARAGATAQATAPYQEQNRINTRGGSQLNHIHTQIDKLKGGALMKMGSDPSAARQKLHQEVDQDWKDWNAIPYNQRQDFQAWREGVKGHYKVAPMSKTNELMQ